MPDTDLQRSSGGIGFFEQVELTNGEFNAIRKLIYDAFGISLADHKRSLVKSRLQKLIRSLGLSSYRDYIEYVQKDGTGDALATLANQISTNYTYFNRESQHFDFYRETVLPEWSKKLAAAGKRDLRIWCAGCSSGEEAYTLQILAMEFFGPKYSQWDAGLLATDISSKALHTAIAGRYAIDSVERLPPDLRTRHFQKADNETYLVKDTVKKEILFRRLNLMDSKLPFRNRFHAIFCRNVMIYFDQETRAALIKRYHDVMEPGAYLFIGHSETLGRTNELFTYIKPAVYKRIG